METKSIKISKLVEPLQFDSIPNVIPKYRQEKRSFQTNKSNNEFVPIDINKMKEYKINLNRLKSKLDPNQFVGIRNLIDGAIEKSIDYNKKIPIIIETIKEQLNPSKENIEKLKICIKGMGSVYDSLKEEKDFFVGTNSSARMEHLLYFNEKMNNTLSDMVKDKINYWWNTFDNATIDKGEEININDFAIPNYFVEQYELFAKQHLHYLNTKHIRKTLRLNLYKQLDEKIIDMQYLDSINEDTYENTKNMINKYLHNVTDTLSNQNKISKKDINFFKEQLKIFIKIVDEMKFTKDLPNINAKPNSRKKYYVYSEENNNESESEEEEEEEEEEDNDEFYDDDNDLEEEVKTYKYKFNSYKLRIFYQIFFIMSFMNLLQSCFAEETVYNESINKATNQYGSLAGVYTFTQNGITPTLLSEGHLWNEHVINMFIQSTANDQIQTDSFIVQDANNYNVINPGQYVKFNNDMVEANIKQINEIKEEQNLLLKEKQTLENLRNERIKTTKNDFSGALTNWNELNRNVDALYNDKETFNWEAISGAKETVNSIRLQYKSVAKQLNYLKKTNNLNIISQVSENGLIVEEGSLINKIDEGVIKDFHLDTLSHPYESERISQIIRVQLEETQDLIIPDDLNYHSDLVKNTLESIYYSKSSLMSVAEAYVKNIKNDADTSRFLFSSLSGNVNSLQVTQSDIEKTIKKIDENNQKINLIEYHNKIYDINRKVVDDNFLTGTVNGTELDARIYLNFCSAGYSNINNASNMLFSIYSSTRSFLHNASESTKRVPYIGTFINTLTNLSFVNTLLTQLEEAFFVFGKAFKNLDGIDFLEILRNISSVIRLNLIISSTRSLFKTLANVASTFVIMANTSKKMRNRMDPNINKDISRFVSLGATNFDGEDFDSYSNVIEKNISSSKIEEEIVKSSFLNNLNINMSALWEKYLSSKSDTSEEIILIRKREEFINSFYDFTQSIILKSSIGYILSLFLPTIIKKPVEIIYAYRMGGLAGNALMFWNIGVFIGQSIGWSAASYVAYKSFNLFDKAKVALLKTSVIISAKEKFKYLNDYYINRNLENIKSNYGFTAFATSFVLYKLAKSYTFSLLTGYFNDFLSYSIEKGSYGFDSDINLKIANASSFGGSDIIGKIIYRRFCNSFTKNEQELFLNMFIKSIPKTNITIEPFIKESSDDSNLLSLLNEFNNLNTEDRFNKIEKMFKAIENANLFSNPKQLQ